MARPGATPGRTQARRFSPVAPELGFSSASLPSASIQRELRAHARTQSGTSPSRWPTRFLVEPGDCDVQSAPLGVAERGPGTGSTGPAAAGELEGGRTAESGRPGQTGVAGAPGDVDLGAVPQRPDDRRLHRPAGDLLR